MGTTATVTRLPKCDFCTDKARYDGKTTHGPWAYMCDRHWRLHGVGRLGTGFGQELIVRVEADRKEKHAPEESSSEEGSTQAATGTAPHS